MRGIMGKRMRKLITVVFLLTLSLCAIKSDRVYGRELTVVYTANSTGKLRICGCPNDPYGGLVERATLLRRLRSIEKEPFLLVDAGNMVDIFGDFESESSQVIELMNLMGYDAAGVGCYEIFHGIDHALEMSNEASFPFLSATITRKDETGQVFTPYVVKEAGENRVGIMSLCDAASLYRIGDPQDTEYGFLPVTAVVDQVLRELSAKVDFVIVLSQLPHDTNRELVGRYSEIDLVVEAYSNKKYDPPITEPGGIIVSPGNKGQFVGCIVMEKDGKNTATVKDHEFLPVLNFPPDGEALASIAEE